ncbi:MAG: hypothetical protein HEP71_19480 [Roseivirga sp.]|nr:hypothetical protein [Roseivirga sp.]
MEKNPPLHIRDDIRREIAANVKVSNLASLSTLDYDHLLAMFKRQELELSPNPMLDEDQLDKELSFAERVTFRLIRSIPFLLIMLIGAFAIYSANYWWLSMLMVPVAIYFFRYIVIYLRTIIYPGLFIWLLASTFAYESLSHSFIATLLLLTSVYVHQLEVFINNRLLKRVLSSERHFIEYYFRNWILVTKEGKTLNSPKETDSFVDQIDEEQPQRLTASDRIFFCKMCINKSFSPQHGITCGLTSEKPDFEYECKDFRQDINAVNAVSAKLVTRQNDMEEAGYSIKAGPFILKIIATLFVLSDFNYFINANFIGIINSGISSWLVETDKYIYGYSFILPLLLIIVSIVGNLDFKWAYIIALILYGTDSLAALFYTSTWTWYLHLIFMGILIKSLQDIGAFKVFVQGLPSKGLKVGEKNPEKPEEE